jgi:hypothetical protein
MEVKNEYPEIGDASVTSLLSFGSTYLCEKTFSAVAVIKSKQRNCLEQESDLVLTVRYCPYLQGQKSLWPETRPMSPTEKGISEFL